MVLRWYSSGTVEVLIRYCRGTHQVLWEYSSGTVEVLIRYFGSTHQVLRRYSSGTLEVLTRYSCSTHQVLSGYSSGTLEVLIRYSGGTHQVLRVPFDCRGGGSLVTWRLHNVSISPTSDDGDNGAQPLCGALLDHTPDLRPR